MARTFANDARGRNHDAAHLRAEDDMGVRHIDRRNLFKPCNRNRPRVLMIYADAAAHGLHIVTCRPISRERLTNTFP
jgi:hypothetical protein